MMTRTQFDMYTAFVMLVVTAVFLAFTWHDWAHLANCLWHGYLPVPGGGGLCVNMITGDTMPR